MTKNVRIKLKRALGLVHHWAAFVVIVGLIVILGSIVASTIQSGNRQQSLNSPVPPTPFLLFTEVNMGRQTALRQMSVDTSSQRAATQQTAISARISSEVPFQDISYISASPDSRYVDVEQCIFCRGNFPCNSFEKVLSPGEKVLSTGSLSLSGLVIPFDTSDCGTAAPNPGPGMTQ